LIANDLENNASTILTNYMEENFRRVITKVKSLIPDSN